MEISIIMPVYNETVLLKRSIGSVIEQTFRDWELIIVDDGSTNMISAYCEIYLNADSRIKLYRQAHTGLAAARNYGVSLAKGRYIAFLDADDYMHPQMLEQLYKDIQVSGVKLAICNFTRFHNLEPVKRYEYQKPEIWDVSADSPDLKSSVRKDNVYAWNKLYDKSLFDKLKFIKGRFYEDNAVMHLFWNEAGKVSYNSNVLYYYYTNPNGIVQTYDSKKIGDCLWAYTERIDHYYTKQYKIDLKHATHTFLYVAYELYDEGAIRCGNYKKEIRRKIRKRVKKVFEKYDLETYLPFHGKIRYRIFIKYPNLFEAELALRQFRKMIFR